jgi:hypothetical protein
MRHVNTEGAMHTDEPAHTKDLLDRRSVVYSFTHTIHVRAEVPLPLFQHTPGAAFGQWRVIHIGAIGERKQAKRNGLG